MIRLVALVFPVINLIFSVIFFPLYSLVAFFTNWCVISSFLSIVLSICCASVRDINKYQKRLAAVHLVLEISFMLNLVTILMYWGVIHAKVIHKFEGWVLLHMYLVHIFPTVGYIMNAKVTNFILCADHWVIFVPFSLVYSVINYFETKRRGYPLYWFLTWEDWKSPAISLVILIVFCLVWIGLSKLSARRNPDVKKVN